MVKEVKHNLKKFLKPVKYFQKRYIYDRIRIVSVLLENTLNNNLNLTRGMAK